MMAEKEFFTMFPNELLEKIYGSRLSGLEHDLVLIAVRKIFGFHKVTGTDLISLSQFCKLTGRTKEGVRKALKRLVKKNILICVSRGTGRRSTRWTINQDYDSWEAVEVNNRSTLQHEKGVNGRSTLQGEKDPENELENVASDPRGEQPLPHKRKGSKETYQKESENPRSLVLINLIKDQLRGEDEAFELSRTHLDAIQRVSEKFPDRTPESLFHSFKNVLGTSDNPLAAISYWTENVGNYLPTTPKRQEKGLTSIQSNLNAFGKRLQ